MKLEPDALVKWVGEDGGWKVGHLMKSAGVCVHPWLKVNWSLVRHSHTGELEFVANADLSRYPMREEWEAKS
jgi:hypothetical protein